MAAPATLQKAAAPRQPPAEPERGRKRSRSPAGPSRSPSSSGGGGSNSSSDSRQARCQGALRSPSRDPGGPPPPSWLCPMLLRHKHAHRGKPKEEWVLTGRQLFVSGLPKPGVEWMPDLLELVEEAGGTGEGSSGGVDSSACHVRSGCRQQSELCLPHGDLLV